MRESVLARCRFGGTRAHASQTYRIIYRYPVLYRFVPQISTTDRTHARTGPDTQRAQAHNHTQNSNTRTQPRHTRSRSHAHTHPSRHTPSATPFYRGEPGHTRDTRDTRAHAGKRITRTNLTTIHPNPKTQTRTKTATDSTAARTAASPESTAPRGRLRRGRPRRTRPCLHPLPERLPAPARRRSAK